MTSAGTTTISTDKLSSLLLYPIDSSLSLSILSTSYGQSRQPSLMNSRLREKIASTKRSARLLEHSSDTSYRPTLSYTWLNIEKKALGPLLITCLTGGSTEYATNTADIISSFLSRTPTNVGYTTQALYHCSRHDELNLSWIFMSADLLKWG